MFIVNGKLDILYIEFHIIIKDRPCWYMERSSVQQPFKGVAHMFKLEKVTTPNAC